MSRSESPPVHGPEESPQRSSERDPEPKLWVELGIDVGRTRGCPLGRRIPPIERGTVQIVGTTCHITAGGSGTTTTGMRTVSTEIDDGCLCPFLNEAGLTPVEIRVEAGTLVVDAVSSDREHLGEATAQLEGKAEGWRLRRLTTGTGEHHTSMQGGTATIEELNLTEKQQEAVQLAVDEGYYDRPRNVSLGELADRIDITRSAMSQRLNAVESKLIVDLSRHL